MHHFDKPKCEIIIFVFGLNFKKYKGENRRECKRRIGKIIKETNEEGHVTLMKWLNRWQVLRMQLVLLINMKELSERKKRRLLFLCLNKDTF